MSAREIGQQLSVKSSTAKPDDVGASARQAGVVQTLSSPAVGTAADIAKDAFSEGQLEILFLQAGLDRFVPKSWYGKAKLVGPTVRAACAAAEEDPEAVDGLREFVRLVAEKVAPGSPDGVVSGTPYWKLRDAIRAAGFELHAKYEEYGAPGNWGPSGHRMVGVRLLPLDDPQVPLSSEITALEHDFQRLGMSVALNCYKQAVDNLVDLRFEAANGQLRALLEEVAVHLATLHGFTRTQQGEGGRAIAHLISTGRLAEDNGGMFVRGLWKMTHTNGPHPGTSNAGEARVRLQAVTAAARLMVDKLAPRA